MTFEEAKALKEQLDSLCTEFGAKLQEYSIYKNSMGLLPDYVKELPQFKEAKLWYDTSFKNLQNFNKYYVKTFKKEIRAARDEKIKLSGLFWDQPK